MPECAFHTIKTDSDLQYFMFTKPVATSLKNIVLWFSVLKHRSTVFKVTTIASVNKHAVRNSCMKPEAHHSIHFRSQAGSCRIYGERSGKGTGFSPSTRLSTVTVHHNCTFIVYSSTANACRPTLILAIDSMVTYKILSLSLPPSITVITEGVSPGQADSDTRLCILFL